MQEQQPGGRGGRGPDGQLFAAARIRAKDPGAVGGGTGGEIIGRPAVDDDDLMHRMKLRQGFAQSRAAVEHRDDDGKRIQRGRRRRHAALQLAPPSTQNWAQKG